VEEAVYCGTTWPGCVRIGLGRLYAVQSYRVDTPTLQDIVLNHIPRSDCLSFDDDLTTHRRIRNCSVFLIKVAEVVGVGLRTATIGRQSVKQICGRCFGICRIIV
jgi:hypothetical protein